MVNILALNITLAFSSEVYQQSDIHIMLKALYRTGYLEDFMKDFNEMQTLFSFMKTGIHLDLHISTLYLSMQCTMTPTLLLNLMCQSQDLMLPFVAICSWTVFSTLNIHKHTPIHGQNPPEKSACCTVCCIKVTSSSTE